MLVVAGVLDVVAVMCVLVLVLGEVSHCTHRTMLVLWRYARERYACIFVCMCVCVCVFVLVLGEVSHCTHRTMLVLWRYARERYACMYVCMCVCVCVCLCSSLERWVTAHI